MHYNATLGAACCSNYCKSLLQRVACIEHFGALFYLVQNCYSTMHNAQHILVNEEYVIRATRCMQLEVWTSLYSTMCPHDALELSIRSLVLFSVSCSCAFVMFPPVDISGISKSGTIWNTRSTVDRRLATCHSVVNLSFWLWKDFLNLLLMKKISAKFCLKRSKSTYEKSVTPWFFNCDHFDGVFILDVILDPKLRSQFRYWQNFYLANS